MDVNTFKKTIFADLPPANISVQLLAMWYEGKGNWAKAHSLADNLDDTASCRVHAYLHRKEGDTGNADYWYRRAGEKRPAISLDEEWDLIVQSLLT